MPNRISTRIPSYPKSTSEPALTPLATTGLFADNTYKLHLSQAIEAEVYIRNTSGTNTLNYRIDLSPGKTTGTEAVIWVEKTASTSLAVSTDISITISENWAQDARIQIDDTSAHADAIVTFVTALADDTITVNGLVYTAVAGAKTDNTEFSIDGSDTVDAADFIDSLANDTRTPVTVPAETVTGTPAAGVVTIEADRGGTAGNFIDLSSSNGSRLAITGDTGGLLDGGTDVNTTFEVFNNVFVRRVS